MTRTNDPVYLAKRAKLRQPGVICELCGQEIDITLGPYDPMSFSSDHAQAVGKGGDNRGALLPMHRVCNQQKGTKDLELVRVDRHSRKHY